MASHESSDSSDLHPIYPRLNIVRDQSESTTSQSSQESSKEISSPTPESASSSTTHSTPSTVSQPEPVTTSSPVPGNQRGSFPECQTSGMKLVLDNIDKTVRPRHQTSDAQTKSLHYIQVYGVKDRVNFTGLSTSPPPIDKSVYDILPSGIEYQTLKDNFAILVARILVEHIPFFREDFSGLITNHIPHCYSTEMTNKSEVVSDI